MSKLKYNYILKFQVILFIVFSQNVTIGQNKVDSLDIFIKNNEILKAIDLINSYDKDKILAKSKSEFVDLKLKESKLYASLNDYEKSIDLLYKCLQKIKSTPNLQTKVYLELGTQFSVFKDTLNSFKNYHKAEKIARKNKDNSSLRHIYHNLFRLHVLKNADSAYYYIQKKYQVDLIKKEPSGLAITYNNFFAYYSVRNEFDEAKKYLDSAYQLSTKHNIDHAIRTSLSNYGYYYSVEKKDFTTALKYYKILQEEHISALTQNEKANLYLNLGYIYENLGDYANANLHHVFYIEMSEKIYNEKINDAVKEIQTKYKIEKIENDHLEEKKRIIEKESFNQKIIIFFVFLTTLLLFMFYFYYQNIKLKERNREKEIDSILQKKIINANIDGQEKERKQIANILHDKISALLSSANLHLKSFESQISSDDDKTRIIKIKDIIKEAHDQVRDLSHHLIPPILIKLGLQAALQDLCERNSNDIIRFKYQEIPNEIILKKDLEIKIYYVVSELINNIIKHSEANEAFVYFEIIQNNLNIQIKDNGIGIKKQDKKKGGLGLQQTATRIHGLNGNIDIKNFNGMEINIQIPLDFNSIT